MRTRLSRAAGLGLLLLSFGGPLRAQESAPGAGLGSATPDDTASAPTEVVVRPGADDAAISGRLQGILQATGWFDAAHVRTRQGVVFLTGTAESERRKVWAGGLARNTQDVVAVVNQMSVRTASLWDFGPAFSGLRELLRSLLRGLPGLGFALMVLLATWLLSRVVRPLVERLARRRIEHLLLRQVLAHMVAIGVMLFGVYVVLYLGGLTRLAVTVLGGTGLVGLVLGIAFRDITENFLASVFLSVQQPFRVHDLIEVAGVLGLVQRITFRSTILMTLDGNHLQVPNAIVYKSVIRNFTSNPQRRESFDVGIGFAVPISRAQEIAREVLQRHPAVLDDPEPWVLVHSLGSATVQLRIYFWMDGNKHSWLKVRSSVIRLVKRAFQEGDVSMPDEAREVVFPEGLPVRLVQDERAPPPAARPTPREMESSEVATSAEGQLNSDVDEVNEQAKRSRSPEEGADLLADPGIAR